MTLTTPESQEENTQVSTKTREVFDVIIVGGGVAGLSAGLYAARDGFKTLILEGEAISSVDYPGGALMLTPEIENFPGFTSGAGEELIDLIRNQALSFGAVIVEERANSYDFIQKDTIVDGETVIFTVDDVKKLHVLETTDHVYESKTVILTMGATARLLQVNGELDYYGKGVSTCATCDGYFFKGQTVAVIGGGDTAVEDALFLTRYAEKVYLVVRGDTLRASGPQAQEILTHPQVEIIWNTVVNEILGDVSVNGVRLVSNGTVLDLNVNGVFVAIGRDPSTASLLDTGVLLDDEGYIVVEPGSTHVSGSVKGVFAAGDVVDKVYRQAITSAGTGAESAIDSRHFILAH